MKILAIESSADETAAAVVEDGTKIISNIVASSTLMHQKWGGIVPEVAAREQLKCILPVIKEALLPLSHSPVINYQQIINSTIDSIAVTVGPGLIGSLLIGVETAKTIAFVTGKPIIPVNHVLAHMYANFVDDQQPKTTNQSIVFPAISLVVSGGHTELFLLTTKKDIRWLGGTVDDAAGEAFDKTARLLGFENLGGPAIQRAAKKYQLSTDTYKIKLPRPLLYDHSLNFSFSGLKTAILREWKKYDAHDELLISSFAYEVQEAITDVLVSKTLSAASKYNAKSILISGGVSSNLRLREKLQIHVTTLKTQVNLRFPPVILCTDNAVYIGSYAYFRGNTLDWHDITAQPDLSVEI